MPRVLQRIVGSRPRAPLPKELDARRSAEREFIKAYDSTESGMWFLVDADWLEEWKRFMLGDGPLPGPIRNGRLLDAEGAPRPGLLRVVDYRGVNVAVWTFLQQRYGGGPAVPRWRLDLYGEAADAEDASPARPLLRAADERSGSSEGSSAPSSAPSGRGARFRVPAMLRRMSRSRSGSLAPPTRAQPASAPPARQSPGADPEGCVFFVGEADARVVAQPMDGSCLFHSISHGLQDGTTASLLRLEISKHIVEHPTMLVADTPLSEWVQFDSGCGVSSYALKMAGDSWGGGIEIEVAAHVRGVNVHVFEKSHGGYQRISCFSAGCDGAKTVNVLYQGRCHYDALEISDKAGKWIPRVACDSRM